MLVLFWMKIVGKFEDKLVKVFWREYIFLVFDYFYEILFFFKNKVYEMIILDFENWIFFIFGGSGWGGGGGILKKSWCIFKFIYFCNIGLKFKKLVSWFDIDYIFNLFIY